MYLIHTYLKGNIQLNSGTLNFVNGENWLWYIIGQAAVYVYFITINIIKLYIRFHVDIRHGQSAHDNQLICTILGIILHYLWLTAFSFMSVAIIFLVKDIKKNSNQNHDQRKQSCSRNWSLTLLGLTLPMVLLAPAVENIPVITLTRKYTSTC
jgi:hypothetical protein